MKKKLIEVAMPLDTINRHCVREKSVRHGHPSTLHLWWARRPLASVTAIIFASTVTDPSSDLELFPTLEDQKIERARLFDIIDRLCDWDNWQDQSVIEEAQVEMCKNLGPVAEWPITRDPFSGGGTTLLAAQRLGFRVEGEDLNPVAVLICKALVEIPFRFSGHLPVNPHAKI